MVGLLKNGPALWFLVWVLYEPLQRWMGFLGGAFKRVIVFLLRELQTNDRIP